MIPERAVYIIHKDPGENGITVACEKIEKSIGILLQKKKPRPSAFRLTLDEFLMLVNLKSGLLAALSEVKNQEQQQQQKEQERCWIGISAETDELAGGAYNSETQFFG